MTAETRATELTEGWAMAIRTAIAEGYHDHTSDVRVFAVVERMLAAKPAPSGDEREALAEVERHIERLWSDSRSQDGVTRGERLERTWALNDALNIVRAARTVSPAPSGAEAALERVRALADAEPWYPGDKPEPTALLAAFESGWVAMRARLRAALSPSAGPDTTCRHRYPDGTTCTLTDHSAPGVAEVHGQAGPDTTEGGA